MKETIYSKNVNLYDKIYSEKNYLGEVFFANHLIRTYLKNSGRKLLDVACGAGYHLQYLSAIYEVSGFDKSKEMIKKAKEKLPKKNLTVKDALKFSYNFSFDIITCFFNSVGIIAHSKNDLEQLFKNIYSNLNKKGIFLFDYENFENSNFYYLDGKKLLSNNYYINLYTKNGFIKAEIYSKDNPLKLLDYGLVKIFNKKELINVMKSVGFTPYLDYDVFTNKQFFIGIKN